MNNKQAIEQLKDLRENQKNFIDDMEDTNNDEFVKDVEALDLAIKALEGTAPEVPVQEQLTKEQAELLLQKQFIVLASYNETSPSLQNITAMLDIYAILFPCQSFQV